MGKYTYLLINFFTVILCFIFSFHKKIRFDRYFLPFLKASVLVAVPFILWDFYFTKTGVWWFNDNYLTGMRIWNLPVEECLFFICIPFSCVYSYFCFDKFFNLHRIRRPGKYFTIATILICMLIGLFHFDKIYTVVTFLSMALSLFYLSFLVKVDWLDKLSLVYIILLLPFFAVNGILTGTGIDEPIVNYHPGDFLGIRLLTIPVEDVVYGFELIMWNVFFFKTFSHQSLSNSNA